VDAAEDSADAWTCGLTFAWSISRKLSPNSVFCNSAALPHTDELTDVAGFD